MEIKWFVMLCLIFLVRCGEATESQSIQVPNQKYALFDIPSGGSDLVLNIVKGTGVSKIMNDGIQLQDGSDITQWAKDQAASQSADHPVYNIVGVNCGKESVCVTGLYSCVGSGGGGTASLSSFDVDVLKMDMICYVDQPVSGSSTPFVLSTSAPYYSVGHTWYELRITDVDGHSIADQKLTQLIAISLFPVMNTTMGWYPKNAPLDMTGVFKIPDTSHTADVTHTYHVGSKGFVFALIYSHMMSHCSNDWNLASFNCTDVAITAGSNAGLTLPDPLGNMPAWLGGGLFSNPGMFGEDLRLIP